MRRFAQGTRFFLSLALNNQVKRSFDDPAMAEHLLRGELPRFFEWLELLTGAMQQAGVGGRWRLYPFGKPGDAELEFLS